MIKSIIIIISFPIFLFSKQQIILVVADDFNSSKAKLECYEENKVSSPIINVNIGKNGLGWGLGYKSLVQKENEPIKQEGDKKAPAGIFKLTSIFGYNKTTKFSLPYLYAHKNLICVDDSNSNYYNKIIYKKGNEKSFEYMKRDDNQYELGIVVQHNKNGVYNSGSCIFMHVQKEKGHSTAGCTSMKLKDLKKIANWLDKDKNPILIQVSKSSKDDILKLYPQLQNSLLLK